MAGELRDQVDAAFQPRHDQPVDLGHVVGHQPLDRCQLVAVGLGFERRSGSSQTTIPLKKQPRALASSADAPAQTPDCRCLALIVHIVRLVCRQSQAVIPHIPV